MLAMEQAGVDYVSKRQRIIKTGELMLSDSLTSKSPFQLR